MCPAGHRALLYPPHSYPYTPSPLSCLALTQATFETPNSQSNRTQRKRPCRKDLLASDTPRDEDGLIIGLYYTQCCIFQESQPPQALASLRIWGGQSSTRTVSITNIKPPRLATPECKPHTYNRSPPLTVVRVTHGLAIH